MCGTIATWRFLSRPFGLFGILKFFLFVLEFFIFCRLVHFVVTGIGWGSSFGGCVRKKRRHLERDVIKELKSKSCLEEEVIICWKVVRKVVGKCCSRKDVCVKNSKVVVKKISEAPYDCTSLLPCFLHFSNFQNFVSSGVINLQSRFNFKNR